ncbi:MAG: DUF1573 domain-containing protein [Deltaproteobacteria bacterium]|nr:DUF1573 domain-containing protein [Deltaproteobacteria bacterium]
MRVRSKIPWLIAVALAGAGLWGCKGDQAALADKKPAATDANKARAGSSKGGPSIACDKPDFEFGKVAQGEEMKHVFTIKNTGDDVLNILSARGG